MQYLVTLALARAAREALKNAAATAAFATAFDDGEKSSTTNVTGRLDAVLEGGFGSGGGDGAFAAACAAELAELEGLAAGADAADAAAAAVRIKWPNDLYAVPASGRGGSGGSGGGSGGGGGSVDGGDAGAAARAAAVKVGGVLCQSSVGGDGCYEVVVGVGVNVSNAAPTTCLNALLPGGGGGGGGVTREALLAGFLNEFEALRDEFVAGGASGVAMHGFAPFKEEYERLWLHSGQRVAVAVEGSGKEGAAGVQCTVRGLSATGNLLAAEVATGAARELYPDGNRLDFFQGLITRK